MERRLAAVLVADVAGYSRLVGLDEEGTYKRLMGLRADVLEPLTVGHEGRIVDYAGDGVLVHFPSTIRAVECAIAIQRAAAERDPEVPPDRRMALRIGVHAGDVIVDADGGIYGDAVNIAARLEQLVEPGGVCLSDRVHEEAAGRVDAAFEHGGEPPLKNIARSIGIWLWPASDRGGQAPRILPPADKPSIAVLPFESFGGGADSAALADGMVEDLTTALARLNWMLVVARTSTFALKGQVVDAREAGRRLGVRYLLEGSVRCTGEQVRVTGQLVDAESGVHIWADRFDGSMVDIFGLQDRIVASTVGAIEPSMMLAEAARTRVVPMEEMQAHQLYLRAYGLMGEAFTNPGGGALDEARALLTRAIELDPTHAPALALAGYYEAKAALFGLHKDSAAGKKYALELAERAVRADPEDALALGAYGFVSANAMGDLDRASIYAERALAANQNSPLLWNFAGEVSMYLGHHDRAIECFHRSMRLNPLDPRTVTNATYLAFAYLFRGQPDEAVRWGQRAVLIAPNPLSYRGLAAALGAAGRIDEARAAAAELLRLQPTSCLRRSRSSNYRNPEDRETYVESLRKAGLPEEPIGKLADRI